MLDCKLLKKLLLLFAAQCRRRWVANYIKSLANDNSGRVPTPIHLFVRPL